MFGTFFLGVLFLQHVLRFGPLQAGLAFLPQTLTVAVMSTGPTRRLMRVLGAKPTAMAGMVCLFMGLTLFSLVTPHTVYFPQLFFALLCTGVGSAMAFTSLLTIGVADIPHIDAGLGSGVVNVSQQFAAAIAVAVLSVVATSRTETLLRTGSPAPHALTAGYRLGFLVAMCCVAAGAVVAAVLMPSLRDAEQADLAPVVESVDI
jgi:MFS family permease